MPLDEYNPLDVGIAVRATGRDYSFDGWIVAVFFKKPRGREKGLGPLRYVVQDSRGLLLIHSSRTLELR